MTLTDADADVVIGFFAIVVLLMLVVAIRDSLARRRAARGWKRGR